MLVAPCTFLHLYIHHIIIGIVEHFNSYVNYLMKATDLPSHMARTPSSFSLIHQPLGSCFLGSKKVKVNMHLTKVMLSDVTWDCVEIVTFCAR